VLVRLFLLQLFLPSLCLSDGGLLDFLLPLSLSTLLCSLDLSLLKCKLNEDCGSLSFEAESFLFELL
jgi:hypothetical protein